MRLMVCVVSLMLAACTGEPDCSIDSDQDGLTDCAEEQLGTDPLVADSDGDGFSDLEEVDCVSDPLDGQEACYACGWAHNDPGTLTHSGSAEGDTIKNIALLDQCQEPVDLWDFAGAYHILYMTKAWCGVCLAEAQELAQRSEDFMSLTEIPFSYMILLATDYQNKAPEAEDALSYAEEVETWSIPVVADPAQESMTQTPWNGSTLPGKCVLSRDMVMMDCYNGHGDDQEAMALIEQDYYNSLPD